MPEAYSVLVCDKHRTVAESVASTLAGCGYRVEVASAGSQVFKKLLEKRFSTVVLGIHGDDEEASETISLVHEIDRNLPVVVIGYDVPLAIERDVRQTRVFYYLVQPVDPAEVEEAVRQSIEGRSDAGFVAS